MTPHPRTVSEGTPIEETLSLMRSGSFRRVPLVDDDGRPVGILSLDDVPALRAEEFAAIRGLLEREAAERERWPRA